MAENRFVGLFVERMFEETLKTLLYPRCICVWYFTALSRYLFETEGRNSIITETQTSPKQNILKFKALRKPNSVPPMLLPF